MNPPGVVIYRNGDIVSISLILPNKSFAAGLAEPLKTTASSPTFSRVGADSLSNKSIVDISSSLVGLFEIESRAQMAMLPRLQPKCFYDLVIEIGIVRPGPIQGDMVHPYLRRRAGKEPITFPSNAIKDVLMPTLGVPIFQEQVMRLSMVAAGFTGGEADELRRAITNWGKNSKLLLFEDKLKNGLLANGYTQEFADMPL